MQVERIAMGMLNSMQMVSLISRTVFKHYLFELRQRLKSIMQEMHRLDRAVAVGSQKEQKLVLVIFLHSVFLLIYYFHGGCPAL